ncbi:MAG: hypothetical protein IJP35_03970 [Clostridia bacterium]|nr:hypothetical protein [Clostridia bacterium]
MKKLWIYGLILCMVLLCFSACGKGDVTPTDVTPVDTVLSGIPSDPADKDVGDGNEQTASQPSISASESQKELQSEVSQAPIDSLHFVQHKGTNESDGVFWELPYGSLDETGTTVTKVSSAEQLKQILTGYQMNSDSMQSALRQYSADYFEQADLLLIAYSKPETSAYLLVKGMSVNNNWLNMNITIEDKLNGQTMVTPVLYPVEVEGLPDDVTTVRCDITYQFPSKTEEKSVTVTL